jgi:hypothetical protein
MMRGMSDEKPNPFEDVRKGLGLLFRAAKTAAQKLPTTKVEEVVATGAREVGRAIENVASTIEREVFGQRGGPPSGEAKSDPSPPPKPDEPPADQVRVSQGPPKPDDKT